MTQLANPHDAFFKEVFSQQDAARSFLANYLPPEISSLFNLDKLTIDRDSFVDEDLRLHYSDILYQVALQDGGEGYVYLLFEHKSYPDPWVAFQLLRYMARIWERQRKQKEKLRPIFPIVIYHGKTKWNHPLDFASLIEGLPEELRPYLPDYHYRVYDLSQYSDEAIIGSVVLQIALLLLKYILRDELQERVKDILQLLAHLSEQEIALGYLRIILKYLSEGTDKISKETLQQAVEEVIPAGGTLMPTIAEQWF